MGNGVVGHRQETLLPAEEAARSRAPSSFGGGSVAGPNQRLIGLGGSGVPGPAGAGGTFQGRSSASSSFSRQILQDLANLSARE